MQARIMIIEDEHELASLVQMYLERDGIESDIAESAEAGLYLCLREQYDLVVLDINLPGMDGFEFLETLRKSSTVPVMIVSAREADEDVVMGLGMGADEFVSKPFAPKVLVARIRALLRRSRTTVQANTVHFGPYSMDLEGYVLHSGERRVPLASKEFEVLRYLIQQGGRARNPEDIYANVWGDSYGDITTVAVYVQRLRAKIEENPKEPVYIQTIHGKGYRFNSETVKER